MADAEAAFRAALGQGVSEDWKEHWKPEAAFNFLGQVLSGTGRFDEAEELYRDAVAKGIEGVLLNYANLLSEQEERRDEAEQLYLRAVEAGDHEALNNLATLLDEMGRRLRRNRTIAERSGTTMH